MPANRYANGTANSWSIFFMVQDNPITVHGSNLAATSDFINIEILQESSFASCFDYTSGTQIRLSSVRNPIAVIMPGRYRASKPTTVNSVGGFLDCSTTIQTYSYA